MKVSKSVILAVGIGVLGVGYFGINTLVRGEPSSAEDATEGAETAVLPEVQARWSEVREYRPVVILRGRTQANRSVEVRAESAGAIISLSADQGDAVAEGDVLCQLAVDARAANREEARARLAQTKLEYDAAQDLSRRGVRSATQVAAAKAALDGAKAGLARAEIEYQRTQMKAPFTGVLNTRPMEVGDFMQPGSICGTVVELDPILAVAEASENDVLRLRQNLDAVIQLKDGGSLEGRLRYVSSEANETTRTFAIEVEADNPDGVVRSGVSASIAIRTDPVPAHRISPSILTLNDEGALAVRTVVDDRIAIMPVAVIDDNQDGVWVQGLPERSLIVTVSDIALRDGAAVKVQVLEAEKGANA